MPFCPKCGKAVSENVSQCPYCGSTIHLQSSPLTPIVAGLRGFVGGLTAPNMEVKVMLSKNAFLLGEDLTGDVVLQPNEPVLVRQVEVRIKCTEHVKKKKISNTGEYEYWDSAVLYDHGVAYSLGAQINPEYQRRVSFKINVPLAGRPSYKSVDSNVEWTLDVLIHTVRKRTIRRKFKIQIANAPPSSIGEQLMLIQKDRVREIEVIYCRYCGTKNNVRSANCIQCGAPLR